MSRSVNETDQTHQYKKSYMELSMFNMTGCIRSFSLCCACLEPVLYNFVLDEGFQYLIRLALACCFSFMLIFLENQQSYVDFITEIIISKAQISTQTRIMLAQIKFMTDTEIKERKSH